MDIDYVQSVAALTVLQSEVALVVHLLGLVVALALEVGMELVLECGARVDATSTLEDIGADFDAGDIVLALGFEEDPY